MKKTVSAPAAAGVTKPAVSATEAVEYRIKPGVTWINGKPVGDQTTIALTKIEAAFDLGLGRIAPASEPTPADWPAATAAPGDADGRD
ncbi:hypothetical protein [Rhizobium sp. RU36D]|uniref:hypothetical protein n=1 Tax=Rhizobium sp. RU36D TaxID=1907415 RepID=UPI0009D8E31D|nr:hypothetical protein [Rhizobium sp. RU36D]SMD18129.1 hypothetical protein SAMN05880593_13422 [Rhizobium sp. RU36D]